MWRAPNGNEYFVAVKDVTKRPSLPRVVPVTWEVRFYDGDDLVYSAPLPGHRWEDDLDEKQLLRIYENSGLG